MRKIFYTILIIICFTGCALSQVPQALNYQAILRNAFGQALTDREVYLRVSIVQGTITGSTVYQEVHTIPTGPLGLVNIAIGQGTVLTGVFDTIHWGIGDHFLKIEVDTTDGSNYVDLGTTQLLSVPYALYAKEVSTVTAADLDHWNAAYGWGNHALAGYLTSYTETDPLFNASPAHSITATQILHWNTAYSWGNHALAGYLTSYTETDPVWLTEQDNYQMNIDTTQWDATRHWVQSQGYLTEYTETDTSFWRRDGTNLMPKNSADNVGIGMTPSYKLDVNGSVRMNDAVTMTGITEGGDNDTLMLALNPATKQLYYRNAGEIGGGGSGGEANTASNLGSGTGLFKQKSGVDLQFYSLLSTNSILTVAHDNPNNVVDLTINQSSIDHNSLMNYDAHRHFFQKNIDTVNTSLSGLLKSNSGFLSSITDNSTNWNTAYSWGNHADAGYLTSETDPQVGSIEENYLSKWDGDALVSSIVYESNTGKIGIGMNGPAEKLEVDGKVRADEGFNCNGSDGISDTVNQITAFDFDNFKLKYRTSIVTGGITTYISPESDWIDTVGDFIIQFTNCGDPLHDSRDGQIYPTVLIGAQCWMAANLNTGTMVNGTVTMTDNGVIEKYCYNNNAANCAVYGGLYQWDEVMNYTESPGAQGICPDGWHIPTDEEWCTLSLTLDETSDCDAVGDASSYIAGGMMKEAGTAHWVDPNTAATNESGFTGLPAGYRSFSSFQFYSLGYYTGFWSSSPNDDIEIWYRDLYYDNGELYRDSYNRSYGFAVRCIMD